MPQPKEDKNYDKIIQAQWDKLLKEANMADIPLELLNQVLIHFKDGTVKSVDISEIADSKTDYKKLESALQRQLDRLSEKIDHVDWVINTKKIVDTVESAKSELFKNKG
jgi:hypothetical protein